MSAWHRLTSNLERRFRMRRRLSRIKKGIERSGEKRVGVFPDLSYAQGESIDWRKVAQSADVVILKATEGLDFVDPEFTDERLSAVRRAAEDAGLIVGYYHFARADNRPNLAGARAEARHFVATCRLAGGRLRKRHRRAWKRWELPGVLDYETRAAGSIDNAWKDAWCDEYRKLTGHDPILYVGNVGREEGLKHAGEPLWIPAYGQGASPLPYLLPGAKDSDLFAHQFTESGAFPGVPGAVDLNRAYVTQYELLQLAV